MRLLVVKGPDVGRAFPLGAGEHVAGRAAGNAIQLPGSHVSNRHCAFYVDGPRVVVRDLNSTNGIYIEGQRVGEAILQHGMRVQVGDRLLLLEAPELMAPPPEPARPAFPEVAAPGPEAGRFAEHQPQVPDHSSTWPSTARSGVQAYPGGFGAPGGAPGGHPAGDPALEHPPLEFGNPAGDPNAPWAPRPTSGGRPEAKEPYGFGSGMFRTAAEPPQAPAMPEPVPPPMARPGPAATFGPAPGSPPASAGFGAPAPAPSPVQQPGGGFPASPAPAPGAFGAPAGGGFAAPAAAAPGAFGAPTGGGFGMPAGGFGISPAAEVSPVGAPGVPEDDDLTGSHTSTSDLDVGASRDWLTSLKSTWRRIRRFPWKLQLVGIQVVVALFLVIAPFGGTISHLFRASNVAEEQALERGRALALALSVRNQDAIVELNNLKLDTSFILGEKGVKMAMITDSRGLVRAPAEKVSQSLAGKEYFSEATTLGRSVWWEKGGGEWHVLYPIRTKVVDGAPASIAGWAYVLYDVDAMVEDSTPMAGRLVMSLLVIALGLGASGVAVWRLVSIPVRGVRDDLELAMRGHLEQVKAGMEWDQMRDLAHSINRLLGRWRQAAAAQPAAAPSSPAADPALLAANLAALVSNLAVPVFLLDAEARVVQASGAASQWLGVPLASLAGARIGDVLPEPAFQEKVHGVCARLLRKEATNLSESALVGANQARIVGMRADPDGAFVLVSIG